MSEIDDKLKALEIHVYATATGYKASDEQIITTYHLDDEAIAAIKQTFNLVGWCAVVQREKVHVPSDELFMSGSEWYERFIEKLMDDKVYQEPKDGDWFDAGIRGAKRAARRAAGLEPDSSMEEMDGDE